MSLIDHPGMKWAGMLTAATLLSACASIGDGIENQTGRIKITSEPAGAVAYADNAEIGATPLEIVPGNHFRSGFVGFTYRYFGKLSIKKAGCETWSTEVNDNILSKDVHAKLKCDPNFRPEPASAPASGNAASSDASATSKDEYLDRLERIETLHKKGLISDEEYAQLRARILDKL